MRTPTVTVRAIKTADWLELQWLASPARVPGSMIPGLSAERDRVPIAAIALSSGAVVTDPADPPPDAARMLKLLRYRVMRQSGHSGAARALLRGARARLAACDQAPLTVGRSTQRIADPVAESSG